MGVGNYYQEDAESVIVRGEQIYGDAQESEDYLIQEAYDNFIENLVYALPKSWEHGKAVRHLESNDAHDRTYNPHVIAANKLFKLSVASHDSDVFVNLEMMDGYDYKDVFHPLARAKQHDTAVMIWKILEGQGFDLWARSCGWTSRPVRFGPPRKPTADELGRIARREGLREVDLAIKRYDRTTVHERDAGAGHFEYHVQDESSGSRDNTVRKTTVVAPEGYYLKSGWSGHWLAVPLGSSDSPHYGVQHNGHKLEYNAKTDKIWFCADSGTVIECAETRK